MFSKYGDFVDKDVLEREVLGKDALDRDDLDRDDLEETISKEICWKSRLRQSLRVRELWPR